MAVLITGGAGYIGSHTCVELLKAGYDIIVLDNYKNSHPESLNRVRQITGKDFKVYQCDLLDEKTIEKVFEKNNINAVIHFAGLKAVGESVQIPLKYYECNILGTVYLCNVMKKYNIKNLVFSSSATVYGVPESIPISEDSRIKAMSPYGRTKQMLEDILRDLYTSDQDWSIALLRYFNPIGAHESGLIGEAPSGIPNNLMPYITQVAIGNLEELTIFGNNYPTKDGTGVRDYIHVVDLAKGHLKALEKVSKSTGVEAYNLGTGKGYSVLEIVEAFEKASKIKIPYKITEPRKGDIAISYADPSKALKELGWIAEKGIEEMCMDSWRWQCKNPNGYTVNQEVLSK
ncbi:UDP-glucose 4-epimerase GalE [Lederbergia wuyishanensis]|uniref:UDP-glucose 4-epimerase n=1 Tax=Lederbergia wuyishanensis TaxID=1347903 RepID=A0ABU0D7R3_9BACI|nr:UDP-glucose 4-epimerase GalE [Lederbergia wuyishanensis]MCJ8009123.1 UDP-glucose 4-epimerase GalE [Lederbergia wuyishanensis]MDQ0344462.1 UDP-glucose 4-epimerase [Lederbergia wuyishanensis]